MESHRNNSCVLTENLGFYNSLDIPNTNGTDCTNNAKSLKKNITYIYNDAYIKTCDTLPKVPHRASLVHSLIEAYGLLQHVRLLAARPAKLEEINQFHSKDYIEILQHLSEEEDEEKYDEEAEQYGLTYDCPAWLGVYEYAAYVVGGSLKAAQSLVMGVSDVAINWPGGWHHAKRDEASGFCYFNDIVLGILTLRKKYDKVLYIDMDLHHGDGVEDAFCATSKVFTLSFHKVSPGFFPGTGKISEVGMSKGKFYNLNVPLKDGIQDLQYITVFKSICDSVRNAFQPDAIVCQCGADGLYGDPMASYNLTPKALARCAEYINSWDLPLLFLGGGGYNLPNTARCWTEITAAILGKILPNDIPEHKYFTKYGPDYQLIYEPGNRPDQNDTKYIKHLLQTVEENLANIRKS